MTSWSRQAWRDSAPIFNQIISHPFLLGLVDGSLPRENFNHFAKQKCLFLFGLCRSLGALSSRCKDVDHAESFLTMAVDTASTKQALQSSFSPQERGSLAPTPICLALVSYLHTLAFTAPLESAVAAVASCFWVKEKISDHVRGLDISPANPYISWLSLINNMDEFHQAMLRPVGIADEMAKSLSPAGRSEMTNTFHRCSQLYWMFLDGAWKREEWPV